MPALLETLESALSDRYRLGDEIGRGGMATVYLADDLRHGRKVAIKVLHPTITGVSYQPDRFLREIRIAASLNHPNILPVFDSGRIDPPVPPVSPVPPVLYFVMPFMDGESLRARLERTPQLPVEEALSIARGVASALDYAHRHQVIHRDIKPENILMHEGQPIVADFGIAKALAAAEQPADLAHSTRPARSAITWPGVALGTPAYMSPEQATADDVDARSDLYSLACVLFEMLTGEPPFAGSTPRATMIRHATEMAKPVRALRVNVPTGAERAVARALAKEPTDRFASAAEFAEALTAPPAPGVLPRPVIPTTAIAVLPFVNASADPDTEYFSDGMTDELINALAKVEGLRVSSRSSVFALKTSRPDLRSVGTLLDVTAVLEGSVRKSGDRLRITAQLGNAADGTLLWSERFDREIEDVFAIQDEIAGTIVNTLRARLLGDLGDPTPRRYTDNLKAYNLYLMGRYAWNRRTADSIAEGVRYFEQAIAEDPGYALAYTGLSDSHALAIDYRGAPVAEGMRLAKQEARRALQLDESLAEAHTSLAWVTFIYDWDWQAAEREFRRAIELNPRYASARQWYAWLLLAMGRMDEAMAQGRAAADLDPASISVRRSLGWLYVYARQPDVAIEQLRHAVAMNPAQEETHVILGQAYAQKGMYAEAESQFREAAALTTEVTRAVAALGVIAAKQGRDTEAREVLSGLYERAARRYVTPVDFVGLHVSLGEFDRAFEWLERAYEERRGWLVYLNTEPALDPLRQDPRFRDLRRRMRLD